MAKHGRVFVGEEGVLPRIESIETRCTRATFLDVDPLLLHEECAWGGRYHNRGGRQCLYCGLDGETPIAELERRVGASLSGTTLHLTELQFSGQTLVASDRESLSGLKLVKDDLTGEQVNLCRNLAHYARFIGVDALLVPSAARQDRTNLVVLFEAVSHTIAVVSESLTTIED